MLCYRISVCQVVCLFAINNIYSRLRHSFLTCSVTLLWYTMHIKRSVVFNVWSCCLWQVGDTPGLCLSVIATHCWRRCWYLCLHINTHDTCFPQIPLFHTSNHSSLSPPTLCFLVWEQCLSSILVLFILWVLRRKGHPFGSQMFLCGCLSY